MSTVIKDKNGKVIKTLPDTKYHPQGTGARASDGKLLDHAPAVAEQPAVAPTPKPEN